MKFFPKSLLLSVFAIIIIVGNSYGFLRFDNRHLPKINRYVEDVNTSISTLWIDQPLDHFASVVTGSWKMRYFENLEFYRSGGPIMLYIGGEGRALPSWLKEGFMASFAKEIKGAMFMSEHRFYGDSIPNNDLSVENLAYLSSLQALADLKNLLQFIKSQSKFQKSKVVVFGGSYAGNLAAWLKLLYPDLIDAALSSSGPVLAKTNFYEYLEVVGDAFKKYGTPGCYDKIVKTFQRYEELFKTAQGIEQLKKEENICQSDDMNVLENKYVFFMINIAQYSVTVQYGSPEKIHAYCLQDVGILKHNTVPGLNIWNEKLQCHTYNFNDFINTIKSGKSDYEKQWIYQTCTEFGYMQSTSSNNHPFTNNLPTDFFVKMCAGIFGPEFDQKRVEEGVKKTNDMYGGLTPNVEKVIFVNGDMDPWHKLSVLKDLSNDAPAKIIPKGSHCSDLDSDDQNDMPERVAVRKFVKRKLKEWIGL